jgi:hypothetical protein
MTHEARGREANPWSQLSPEEYQWGQGVITALTEKFGRDPSDFSPITMEGEDGTRELAIALTATQGIDFSDPSRPFDTARQWDFGVKPENSSLFIITLGDNTEVDTREGATEPWLNKIAQQNPEISEWEWRYGERNPRSSVCHPVSALVEGQAVDRTFDSRVTGFSTDVRFRPIVSRTSPTLGAFIAHDKYQEILPNYHLPQ